MSDNLFFDNKSEISGKITDVNNNLLDANIKFDNIISELGDVNTRLDDTISELEGVNTRLDDIFTESENTNTKLDNTISELEGVNSNLLLTNSKLDSALLKIDDINSKLIKDIDLYIEEGKVFNYLDYLIFAASETKKIVFDPSLYTGPKIFGFTPSFLCTAGPFIIDVYFGTDANNNGTLLPLLNRNAMSTNAVKSVMRLNPTVNNNGIRTGGRIVPGSGLNPSTATPSESIQHFIFIINPAAKIMFSITNNNGNSTYLELDFNFVEV